MRRLLVAVTLTQLLVVIDFFALNLTLPPMAHDFGVAPTDLQFVISGYMIALGACMIPAGRIADLIGRRKVTVAGVVIFGAASFVCGVAPDETIVVVARLVEGVGAAMCFPVSIAMVTAALPADQVQRALGVVYGFAAMGTAVGPLVGGVLSQFSWRWVFLLNVPLAALVTVLLLTSVGETRDATAERKIDWLGAALVASGLVIATVAIDSADTWGWLSVKTIGGLTLGIGLLIIFVVVELRLANPLVDLRLFRDRAYAVIVAAGTVANAAYCVTIFAATLYLQDVRGLSPTRSALVFLALAVGAAAAGQLAGRLENVLPQWVSATALGVGGIGLVLLTQSEEWIIFVPAFALVGVGLGLGWAYASVGTQVVVGPEKSGVAAGVTLTVLVAVGGVAVAGSATAIDQLADGPSVTTVGPINDVLTVCAVVCLGAAVLTPIVGRVRRDQLHRPVPATDAA